MARGADAGEKIHLPGFFTRGAIITGLSSSRNSWVHEGLIGLTKHAGLDEFPLQTHAENGQADKFFPGWMVFGF